MVNLVHKIVDNKTEYWMDITECVKGAMESTVTRVDILVLSGENAKESVAEAMAQEVINSIAENDALTIACESMKITFEGGREVTIVQH